MPEETFKLALRMLDRANFRINVVGGIAKRDVIPLAAHLSSALSKEHVEEEERAVLNKLVDYLSGDGARGRGLTIHRGWA
jgi:hypothetical protein